jgi:hypothetical protein
MFDLILPSVTTLFVVRMSIVAPLPLPNMLLRDLLNWGKCNNK